MTLTPTSTELLARARADLRMGVPVVIEGSDTVLVAAIETTTPERFAQIIRTCPDAVLTISARRAETLKARVYDTDLARVEGIATMPFETICALADPALDLHQPMKGPLTCARGGDVSVHRAALRLAKSARLLPAVLVAPIDTKDATALTRLPLADLSTDLATPSPLHEVVAARLPVDVSEKGRLHIFRPDDGGDEHYALEIGRPDRAAPVLTRLHSACVTGDLMGSLKCDCGPQLRAALSAIGKEGHGVLLYLNQEGRGIGLTNKMRAYALQDQGFDTVEANHRLGFEDDERDFRIGTNILKELGFSRARLLTNNPRKVSMLAANGIEVTERVPLIIEANRHNEAYLATKAAKSGHLL